MSRRTRTQLPISETLLVPLVVDPKKVRKRLEHYRQSNKKYYDRTAKLLQPLKEGDVIRTTDKNGKFTNKGTVISKSVHPRSYIVNGKGFHYRRIRRHLRKVQEEAESENDFEDDTLQDKGDEAADQSIVHDDEPGAENIDIEKNSIRRSRFGRIIKTPDRLNL